jgi:hypothetical protein
VHTLTARAPSGPIRRRPVVLERGKTVKVDLASEPPPLSPEDPKKEALPATPPPSATLPPGHADWRHTAGFVALGVGGALLLSGAVLGSEAIGARDAYRGAPTQDGFDHASELQMWTNVAFIAGGVVAASGIALVLWPSPRAPGEPPAKAEALRVAPAPGGVLLEGSF